MNKFKVFFFSLIICLNNFCNVLAINDVNIEAKGFVTFDRNTKQVIWGKNIYDKMPMASTTKIMTGIIAIEYGKLEEIVEVSKNAQNTSGWQLNLKAGDKIKLKDLLYAIMLYSANDGAIAIAEHIGGSVEAFCEMMNNKAKEIGAYNTNFTSPHGLDNANHFSTPYDMAIIADFAMNNELFCNIVKTKSYDVYINGERRTVNNTNKLLNMRENIIGIKTGYTGNAMYCLVSNIKEKGKDIIGVVFGADTSTKRFQESKELLEYTLDNYILLDLKDYLKSEINVKVEKGNIDVVKVFAKQIPQIYIKKSDINNIQIKYTILEKASLPIDNNEIMALAMVYLKDEKLCTIEYVSRESFDNIAISYYYKYILQNYVNLLKINY